jgi:metallo-beta-lactamase family protein
MNITSHGAAREVTGSCHRVETASTRLLIDCGMFQGSAFNDARNFRPFGFAAEDVDAVILTHAHLDHVGRLPKLIREGFKGPIYATPPTVEMVKIILEDAYEIMEEQFEKEYRPKLYEQEDLNKTLARLKSVDYSRWKTIGDLKFRFRDAGHIFGSAFVELEEQGGVRAVFSGDIGNIDTPILRPTAQIGSSDIVYIESTYGNRIHEDLSTRSALFEKIVLDTYRKRGVLLIPSFAVERTQAVLYDLNAMFEHHGMKEYDVYLDSPMAIKMTEVMQRYPQYYDQEAAKLITRGDDFLTFPKLHLSLTRSDSKTINDAPCPKIILAGSGMMNGGRITHHLLRYLSKKTTTLLIVGYQASGTLGRKLYMGEKQVYVNNESVHVNATVVSIGSFSAHGDQRKLVNWIKGAKTKPKKIFCTHGEGESCVALATTITSELGISADAPKFEEVVTV